VNPEGDLTRTTNLINAVKSETRLLILAHLKAQLHGDDVPDPTEALTRRLEAVFETHLANPIRQAVDTALSNTITAAVNGSLLSTLDGVLDQAVDTAIGSAVDSLAGDTPADPASEENPATLPMTGDAVPTDEPAILTMPDAAQVTHSAGEEAVATEPIPTDTMPEPTITLDAEPLPVEEVQTSAEDDTHGPVTDVGEVTPEMAEAIRRLNAEGRSVRSISRTLKVRELLVRFVIDAGPHNG
jgi:hypothetical protein